MTQQEQIHLGIGCWECSCGWKGDTPDSSTQRSPAGYGVYQAPLCPACGRHFSPEDILGALEQTTEELHRLALGWKELSDRHRGWWEEARDEWRRWEGIANEKTHRAWQLDDDDRRLRAVLRQVNLLVYGMDRVNVFDRVHQVMAVIAQALAQEPDRSELGPVMEELGYAHRPVIELLRELEQQRQTAALRIGDLMLEMMRSQERERIAVATYNQQQQSYRDLENLYNAMTERAQQAEQDLRDLRRTVVRMREGGHELPGSLFDESFRWTESAS